MKRRKKNDFNVIPVLLCVILLLLVLVIMGKPSIHSRAIFSPQIDNYCDNSNITALWGVVFYQSSSGITIYTNLSSSSCRFLAYKSIGNEIYYLYGQYVNTSVQDNDRVLAAAKGNFSNSYANSFVGNASLIPYPAPMSNVGDISNRSGINSGSNATTEFNSIFRAGNSNWTFSQATDGGYKYSFTDNVSNLTSMQSITDVVSANYSFSEMLLLSSVHYYCTPNWQQASTFCISNDTLLSVSTDTNNCSGTQYNSTNMIGYCNFNNDSVIGNVNSIDASNLNLDLYIGNTNNYSFINSSASLPVDIKEIRQINSTTTLTITRISFIYDFSSPLDLTAVSVKKQPSSSNFGYMIISGLNVIKSVTIDKINSSSNQVCIKDAHVLDISDLSDDCSDSKEILLACPGTYLNYSCSTDANSFFFTIFGLTSSAIKEVIPKSQCTPNWQCSSFSECIDGQQTQTCTDINGCNGQSTKVNAQFCSVCLPSWSCTDWSSCYKNGTQYRACADINSCGDNSGNPGEEQQCQYAKSRSLSNAIAFFILAILIIGILASLYYLLKKSRDKRDEEPIIIENASQY